MADPLPGGGVIYGLWAAATFFHDRLPWPLLGLVGGWVIAWHGSLQHEIIHGHPTRSRRINTLIGFAPLSLWLPFEVYRQSHLAHHATEHLTDPHYDPEARYLPAAAPLARRWAAVLQATLLGRLVLGPLIEIGVFCLAETRRVIIRRERGAPAAVGLAWPGGGARSWLAGGRVPHVAVALSGLLYLSRGGPFAAALLRRASGRSHPPASDRRRRARANSGPALSTQQLARRSP
jgi:fatty acid desaturase